ncbi:MAG: thrombospondin type 3 repeat-containing protein [Verrucomicrobiota bacterium]
MFAPAALSAQERAAGFFSVNHFQYIEIHNAYDQSFDMQSMEINGPVKFGFSDVGSLIEPGEAVVIVANRAAFERRYGSSVRIMGEFGNWLPLVTDAILRLSSGQTSFHTVRLKTARKAWGGSYARGYSAVREGTVWVASPEGGSPGSVVTPFERWQANIFAEDTPADALGLEADPDGDGLSNLVEFALGGDPLKIDQDLLPVVLNVHSPGMAEFSTRKVPGALRTHIEISTDLKIWSTPFQFTKTAVGPMEVYKVDLTREVPASTTHYLRLRFELEP